jgi:uncharacterized UPF0160 family protein
MIAALNPTWAEDALIDDAFSTALDVAREALTRVISAACSNWTAREIVAAAFHAADLRERRFLELPKFCPWADALLRLDTAGDVLYVLYEDTRARNATWMVQAVPPTAGSFEKRKSLPEAWAGLRDAALAEKTGVADAVFCHPGRFICGARSLNGARKMAALAVAN